MYQRANQHRFQIFSTLVLPIAIGLGLYLLLGLLIEKEVLVNELLLRYLVGHPISKCTTLLFLIGVAALALIANNVFDQFCNCETIELDLEQAEKSRAKTARDSKRSTQDSKPATLAEQAKCLLDQLHEYKWTTQSQYLWRRLASALSFIQRTDNTIGIEDELKYLSDMDRDRQQHRYSLVRILIWATPMLGFLGTVLGISQALGGIQVGADNDFQQMLNSLRGSLFVAFDTTALALTLSMVLMFMQFFIDRFESQLLDIVDRRAHEELSPIYSGQNPTDPQAVAIQEVGQILLAEAQGMIKEQNDLWARSLKTSEKAWTHSVSDVHRSVQENLHASITQAAAQLSDAVAKSSQAVDKQMLQRFDAWRSTLTENADNISVRSEQWQVMLSDNARQLAQSQALVSEQLSLSRDVLSEMNSIQQLLADLAAQSAKQVIGSATPVPDEAKASDDFISDDVVSEEPTLRVIPYKKAANRLNHIYRFVTKTASVSDAA